MNLPKNSFLPLTYIYIVYQHTDRYWRGSSEIIVGQIYGRQKTSNKMINVTLLTNDLKELNCDTKQNDNDGDGESASL